MWVDQRLIYLSFPLINRQTDEKLFKQLENNINNLQLNNIEIYKNDLKNGFKEKSPYNLIFIDNPITNLEDEILDQLNSDFGRIMMIEKISNELGKGVRIIKKNHNYKKEILFDTFSKFELYKKENEFIF